MKLTVSADPTVTIIIVNYNGLAHIRECLDSIAQLNYPSDKTNVIIVDNASSDGSVELIQALLEKNPRIQLIRNETNEGFARPINQAVKLAKTEYVAFLNNDMRVDPEWLKELVASVNRTAAVCASSVILNWDGTQIDFIGAGLNFGGHGFQKEYGQSISVFTAKEDYQIMMPCGGSMIISRQVFQNVGGFDEDFFAYFEDVDLGWRLRLLGYSTYLSIKSIAYHKHSSTSKKFPEYKRLLLYERNALYTLYKNYGDESLHKCLSAALLSICAKGRISANYDPTLYSLKNKNSAAIDALNTLGVTYFEAINQFTQQLEVLGRKRQEIQQKRVVSDKEIFPHFLYPFQANFIHPSFEYLWNSILAEFRIKELFTETDLKSISGANMNKLIIISDDVIDVKMAGPGLRYWNFAQILSKQFQVTLAIPNDTTLQLKGVTIVNFKKDSALFYKCLEESYFVILFGYVLRKAAIQKYLKDKFVVVDLYDSFMLENLETNRKKPLSDRTYLNNEAIEVIKEQMKVGDYFVCSNLRQRDFWLGMLTSLHKITPELYDEDNRFNTLIELLPYGMSDADPQKSKPVLKGVMPGISRTDTVLVWGGGIWEWFDPISLIKAVHEISQTRSDIKLFFMGIKCPNPDVPEMDMTFKAIQLAKDLGLYDKYVFVNYGWVEHQDRQNFLLESDIGVNSHCDNIETRYCFRTRILDYLWCRLPILTTRGDYFSELIEKESLGVVVDYQNVAALKEAILRLTDDKKFYNSCVKNISRLRENYKWSLLLNGFPERLRELARLKDRRSQKKQVILQNSRELDLAMDTEQGEQYNIVGPLISGMSYGQSFRCHAPNLCRIDVFIGTYQRQNHHNLYFYLKNRDRVIVNQVFNVSQFSDNQWLSIDFQPIKNSQNKDFYFFFEAPEAELNNAITFWFGNDPGDPASRRFKNHRPLDGSLVFKTYTARSRTEGLPIEGICLEESEEFALSLKGLKKWAAFFKVNTKEDLKYYRRRYHSLQKALVRNWHEFRKTR